MPAPFWLQLVGIGYASFDLPLDVGRMNGGADASVSAESGAIAGALALAGTDSTTSGETGALFSNYFNTVPDASSSAETGAMVLGLALVGGDQANSNETGTLSGQQIGRLSPLLKQLLEDSDGPFIPVIDIALPGGTWLLSSIDFASTSLGQYEGEVLEWSAIQQAVSDPSSEVQALQTSIRISDVERAFKGLVSGADAALVKGSSILIRLASPKVPPPAWRTLMVGIVFDWSFPAPLQAQLILRTDDLAMTDSEFPKPGLALNRADRPSAEAEAIGKYSPIVLGMQDSQSYQATGMVPCQYVDTVAFKYEAAIGRVGVGQAYVDGAPGSGFAIAYERVGGKFKTVVDFASVQSGKVTADVSGYESVGDGTGTLVDIPTDAIALLFSNFVFDEWLAGLWFPTSPRFDQVRLARLRAYCVQHLYKAARVISEPTEGYSELSAGIQSFEFKAWWTPEGTLALAVEDPTDDPYPVAPVSEHDPGLELTYDASELTTAITASFIRNHAEGTYLQTLEVNDPRRYTVAPKTLELPWGPVT